MTLTFTMSALIHHEKHPLKFEQVYEQYFDFVWANVRRMGVSPAHIDDAVQDVFLAVHRRLPEFEGRASLKTWLFHFVLRVSASYRRSNKGTERLIDAVGRVPGENADAPDTAVHERQATELLHRLLGELSDERREVFVLIELEQLSVPEAAALLELNVNTTYSRLRDARRDFEQAVLRERAREDWRSR